MADLRAEKPDAAGSSLPRRIDGLWASRDFGEKDGTALGDVSATAGTTTPEDTDVETASRCGTITLSDGRSCQ
jgi:hypothetical protein